MAILLTESEAVTLGYLPAIGGALAGELSAFTHLDLASETNHQVAADPEGGQQVDGGQPKGPRT